MALLVNGLTATGDKVFVPGQSSDEPSFPLDPQLRGEGGIYCPPANEDSERTPISDWSDSDDEPKVIEPVKTTRKHLRADSNSSPTTSSGHISFPITLDSTTKRRCGDGHSRKPSNRHAMMSISNSLKEVASALGSDPGGPSSPQQKTRAISLLTKLGLTKAEKLAAMQLIRKDTSFADVLLASVEEDVDGDNNNNPECYDMARKYVRAKLRDQ
ncbi:hypothetical protein C8R45DRAFT_1115883 [Mycena sanguinolenta]|nr:hypothetical protein C8R45DRAFT_1115883 [Mycena sanguinolenta]